MADTLTPAQRASDRLQSRGFGHVVRWTIVLALWTLLISMAIGRFGISNFMQLRENAHLLRESNMRLAIENQLLQERVYALEHSTTAQRLFVIAETGQTDDGQKIIHLDPIPTHPSAPLQAARVAQSSERFAKNDAGSTDEKSRNLRF